ncbi:MAG: DUF3999 family protein [Victivallales bacterium]|nr:DUF3999 family protein [Victivallales bacterium]
MKINKHFIPLVAVMSLPVAGTTASATADIAPTLRRSPQRCELQAVVPGDGWSGKIGQAPLTPLVYDRCRNNYADLRLAGNNGREIPFVVRAETMLAVQTVNLSCDSKLLSFQPAGANCYEVTLRLGDQAPTPSEVIIDTPCHDYEKKVAVSGSNDRQQWQPLLDHAVIYDYSPMIDLSCNRVSFPAKRFQYYRIRIDAFTEQKTGARSLLTVDRRPGPKSGTVETFERTRATFRIDNIHLESKRHRKNIRCRKVISYPSPSFSVGNRDPGVEVVEFTTSRQPLTEVAVVVDDANFYRSVELYGGDNPQTMTPVATGTLFRVSIGNQPQQKLKLTFPERRCKYYQLQIRNADSPALRIKNLQLSGPGYAVVFVTPSPDLAPLNLYFGGKEMSVPNYDLAVVLDRAGILDSGYSYRLGPVAANPWYQPKENKTSPWAWMGRYVLGGALGLMVIFLGWLLFRGLRKIEALPDGQ